MEIKDLNNAKVRIEKYNDYTEKWEEGTIKDLNGLAIGYDVYVNDQRVELGDFIQQLINLTIEKDYQINVLTKVIKGMKEEWEKDLMRKNLI